MIYNHYRGLSEPSSVAVTPSDVVFTLPNNMFLRLGSKGIVPIYINQAIPSGTTTTLPIQMKVNGDTQAVTTVGGNVLTASQLSTGLYLFYFDKQVGIFQIIGV